ncbi:MAG: hypothetical protein ABI192_00040 [Bradyrhizobium sp.]
MAAKAERDWAGKLKAWAEAGVTFHLDSIALHDMLFHKACAPTREGRSDNIIIDHLTWLLSAGSDAGAGSIDDRALHRGIPVQRHARHRR